MLVDTEIGKVNRDWQETTLGSVVDSVIDNRGKTPPLSTQGIKLIETGNVSRSSKYPVLFLDNQKLVDMSTYLNWFRSGHPSPDDILFTTVGEAIPQFCLMGKGEGAIAQNLIALNFVRMKVEPEFMLNYFRQNRFIQQCKNIMLTTAQPSLKVPHLLSLTIFLPPLQEQKAIASVLSSFDDKIELLRKQNQTLEKIAQTLFKHWFVDFNFPDENGSPYKDSGGKMVASELGEIPEGWGVGKLEDIFEINPKESLKKGVTAPYVEMKSLSVNASCISSFELRDFTSGSKFRNGDTLLARITPCLENGKTAFLDSLPQNQVSWGSTEFIVIRSKGVAGNELGYLIACDATFRANAIKNMEGTSGRQRVPDITVREYIFPNVPSEIHCRFKQKIEPIFLKISKNTAEINSCLRIRDLLLPKLISGEIRVKDIPSEMEAV